MLEMKERKERERDKEKERDGETGHSLYFLVNLSRLRWSEIQVRRGWLKISNHDFVNL